MTYDLIDAARRTTRRRAALAGLVVVTLIAIGAAIWLYLTDRGGGGAPPPSTGRLEATGSGSAGEVPRSRSTAGPGVLPDDLTWTEVAGAALPTSSTAGPRDVRDGRARGFSHDRAGAVLSAVHLLVRTAPQVGPAVFDPTLREQVVGPDAASMRDQVTQIYGQMRAAAQVPYGQPLGRLPAALRGFRIMAYGGSEAVVVVLTEATDGTGTARFAATEVRMRWTGGDWALVAPAGGDWNSTVLIITAEQADGFTAFPQVGER